MNKKVTKCLLNHFLNNSAQRQTRSISRVAYSVPTQHAYESDEAILDNSLSKIYCDFLISHDYTKIKVKPSDLLRQSALLSNPMLLQPVESVKQGTEMQARLISTIKHLNAQEYLENIFDETEELMKQISSDQASQYKKYLMYINKLLLNLKGKIDGSLQEKAMALRKVVIRKICDAYTIGEGQKEITSELSRMEVLTKARQYILSGDDQQAKLNYQIVFENLDNNDTIRMEALEYLCKSSQEKGDSTYLMSMMNRIQQEKGEEKHVKCIEEALQELTIQESTTIRTKKVE